MSEQEVRRSATVEPMRLGGPDRSDVGIAVAQKLTRELGADVVFADPDSPEGRRREEMADALHLTKLTRLGYERGVMRRAGFQGWLDTVPMPYVVAISSSSVGVAVSTQNLPWAVPGLTALFAAAAHALASRRRQVPDIREALADRPARWPVPGSMPNAPSTPGAEEELDEEPRRGQGGTNLAR
jgi:hypothetical protein